MGVLPERAGSRTIAQSRDIPQPGLPECGRRVAETRRALQPVLARLWQFYLMCVHLPRIVPALLTCLALIFAAAGVREAVAETRPAAPDFVLKALDGYNYRLSEYRGDVVAVIFWASWCGGCRDELQRLERLGGVYRDAGFQVLGVTVDEAAPPARAVTAAVGATFPQLLDATKSASKAYRLQALPTILLIDRQGVARFAHGELDTRGERELLGELRMLLDE